MKTRLLLLKTLLIALTMGMGTVWGQSSTQTETSCVKVTLVNGNTTTVTYYDRLTTANSITGALNAVGAETAGAAATRKVYTIELLWPDTDPRLTNQYTLDNTTTYNKNYKDITIKTAEGSSFKATIKRGNYAANQGMFSLTNTTSGTLTFENIILDGMNIQSSVAGAILSVASSTVNINTGTVLQNGNTSGNGGLVNVSGGTLNIDGATLQNGTAAVGAIISKAGTGALNITDSEFNGGSAISALIAITAGSGVVTIKGTTINGESATGSIISKAGTGALNIGEEGSPVIINGGSATSALIENTANGEVNIKNTTINGESATGSIISKAGTGALNIGEEGSPVTINGGSTPSTLVNITAGATTMSNTTINGQTSSGTLISNSGTGAMSFTGCTINGSTTAADNTLVSKSNTGATTFTNTTITRNQSKGYGFVNSSSGTVTFDGCTIDGSNNTAATNSLITMGTGALTLNNTTVSGHTVSTANVCAVDATAGTANVNVSGTTNIVDNTSASLPANLDVNGTNRLKIGYDASHNSLTGTIGVTTPKIENEQFAILGNAAYTGYEYLMNDKDEDFYAEVVSNTNLYWRSSATPCFYIGSTTYTTLKAAVNQAATNTTIYSCTNEYTMKEPVNMGSKVITIQPGNALDENGQPNGDPIDHLILNRGARATGDLITTNAALTLNNITLDGGEVDATGSFIKVTAGALTLNNVTINGGKTTANLIHDTGAAAMTITDSEINGTTVANSGNLVYKQVNAASGAVTFTNTTFNGNEVTGDLISLSNTGTNRAMNVTFDNCTVNGATSGSGSLVSKATNGTFSATNGSAFYGNGSTGVLINLSNSTGNTTFTDATINGGTSTGNLLSDAGTGTLSFTDCSINGSTVAASNTLVSKSNTGAVTFTNTTMTRNQSNGYGFINSSTGTVTFTDCIINGSENTSATFPLIKSGTGNLTLTNTMVTGHNVSATGVCAVDATSSGNIDVSGETSITGNTSNGDPANLKASGTNKLRIPNGLELSLTVGVTSTDHYASGQQFAVLGNTSSSGYQYFQNDIYNNLFGKKSGTNITWGEYNLPTDASVFRIFVAADDDYYYYEDLGSAIAKSNQLTENTTIRAIKPNYTAVATDAVAFTANHNVTILPDDESGSFTLKRGAVAGDLLTFVQPGTKTLTLINTTLDGEANDGVTTTGSLIKMGGANILTLNNSGAINNTASSSGVCGIDASGSTGKVNLVGNVNVKDNTADGAEANLKVNGTTRLTLTGNITGEVGVTTPQGMGQQFAYGNRTYTGLGTLKNDAKENLRPYYYNANAIYWQYCYMGLAYTFSGTGESTVASVSNYDLTYTEGIPMVVDQVPYNGSNATVTNLTYFGTAATLKNKNLLFSESMLDKMANGAIIGLPEIMAHFNEAINDAVEGYIAGVNNADSPGSMNVWKKAEYNPETNQIEYTLQYLQLMIQDQPLDFVFSIDQTSTMCTSDATAYGVTAPRVIWMMALLQKTAYELISKNGDGYINRVAFIPWGNTTPTKSNFMGTNDEITEWFSGQDAYSHVAEGTNHALAAQACVEMAHVSLDADRIPIIIYMSDFQANANTNRNNVYVRELRQTTDYKTYAINIFADASAYGDYYQNSGVYFADEPAEFMEAFTMIIKDAIGYYLNKPLVIEDGLSTPLAGITPTASSSDGLLETTAGQASWTLGSQDPLLSAGDLYTTTFTVQLGEDVVYSGQMPTNSGLVVKSEDSPVNSIDGGTITTRSAITLVLKIANTHGAPLPGATFTLEHEGNIWNLTTDANGQIVLPWGENDLVGATTETSTFAFDANEIYTLTQNTTLTGYILPTGSWTLTVGSDYSITPSGTTPAMEAHTGKLEIYNEAMKIARVSNDGGTTWTYHEYLINSSGTGTAQGAFDYANTLSGNVIIETLLEIAVIGSENRYALTEGFTFNGANLTGLTLQTTNDPDLNATGFTSIISRAYDGGSLITFDKASTTMTIQDIILDGSNDTYTCNTNGGLVNVANGTVSLADGATLQHSTVDASHNGGGVYLASNAGLSVSGVVIVEDNLKGTALNNVYLNDATNKYVTIDAAGLECGSRIGITKTTGFSNDSNGVQHTVIAQGAGTGTTPATNCQNAFRNGFLFDDQSTYEAYCLGYGSDYTNDKLYFIATWEGQATTAVAGTDYVLDGEYVTEVKTATGLAYLANDVNSGKNYSGHTVTLSDDIDLNGHYWIPIGVKYSGSCTASDQPFSGIFNGQGKVISNVNTILPFQDMGLFGLVQGGTVKNTFINGGTLAYTSSDAGYLGGIVGNATSTSLIDGCEAASIALSDHNNALVSAGGIAGTLQSGEVRNSFTVSCTFPSNSTNGALVGTTATGTNVKNCFATGNTVALVGNNGGTLSNAYTDATSGSIVGSGNTGSYVYAADEAVTDATGAYTPTELKNGKYKFGMPDQQVGTTPLVEKLNEQASGDYARWSRTMASPINGDYPILMLPDFESAASLTNSVFIEYGEVNDMIQYANGNTSNGGNVYLYGDIDNDGVTLSQSTESNVRLYIHEDIGVEQGAATTVNVRVGVTIKNSRDDETDPNWHAFASALNNVPTGIEYHTSEDSDYVSFISQGSITNTDFNNTLKMDPPKITWDTTDHIGYFPTDTPYGTWRQTPDEKGFFDLYAYYEPYYHWVNLKREGSNTYMDHWHIDTDESKNHLRINYKQEADNSNQMINGKGYLMALSSESMMMADGQLNNDVVTVTIDKTAPGQNTPTGWASEDINWRSINLVGNPYQSYLNFDLLYEEDGNTELIENTFATRDDDGKEYLFYTYEASENADYTPSNLIHPHQGFFVKVKDNKDAGHYSLTFNNDMRVSGNLAEDNPFRANHHNYPLVNLLCFDSHGHRDLTTVEVNRPELGGGQKMFKLVNGDALLYAHLDGGSYQTLFTPWGTNEVPVRFKAMNDGVFTLQWNTLHGEFSYLHLIDNITGADIDMLCTDEYQFEGRSSDYTSRFKLVFHCTSVEEQYDNLTGSETFAFIHDGQLVIDGTGTLQVIDLLGHVLLSREASSVFCIPTSVFPPSVYVLRLINGSDTKTQKLIINH